MTTGSNRTPSITLQSWGFGCLNHLWSTGLPATMGGVYPEEELRARPSRSQFVDLLERYS